MKIELTPAAVDAVAHRFSQLLAAFIGANALEALVTTRHALTSANANDVCDANQLMVDAIDQLYGQKWGEQVQNESWRALFMAAWDKAHTDRFYWGGFMYTPEFKGAVQTWASYESTLLMLKRISRDPVESIASLIANPFAKTQVSTGVVHYEPHKDMHPLAVRPWEKVALTENSFVFCLNYV